MVKVNENIKVIKYAVMTEQMKSESKKLWPGGTPIKFGKLESGYHRRNTQFKRFVKLTGRRTNGKIITKEMLKEVPKSIGNVLTQPDYSNIKKYSFIFGVNNRPILTMNFNNNKFIMYYRNNGCHNYCRIIKTIYRVMTKNRLIKFINTENTITPKVVRKISLSTFERVLFELEEVRVVIRAERNHQVSPYMYERQVGDDRPVRNLIARIKQCVKDLEFEIIQGDGTSVINPSTNLGRIRNSYV